MIKTSLYIISLTGILCLGSCRKGDKADAYGNFEATTVTVSAKANGELKRFIVSEGNTIAKNTMVGLIDTTQLNLEKLHLQAKLEALDLKLQEAEPEIAILLETKENLERERNRTQALVNQNAATEKQLDDYEGEIDVVNQRITSTRRTISITNRSILSERKPLKAQINVLENRIQDHSIENPIDGTVLTSFAEAHEFVAPGTPLYKIANLDYLKLKAYTSAVLLQKVKLNDTVMVRIDKDEEDYTLLEGVLTYIADVAEFAPKTIETKEERVNLVYAIEVSVKNNGYLKIGMPGEVLFSNNKD